MEVCKAMSTAVILGSSPNKEMVLPNGPNGKNLNDKGILELYTLVGVVTGVKTKENKFNKMSNKFIGDFEATCLLTGEQFSSNNLYTAEVLDSVLTNQLAKSDGKGAQFAVVVGMRHQPKLQIGYEYTVAPIVAIKENDAMKELRNAVAGKNSEAKKVKK